MMSGYKTDDRPQRGSWAPGTYCNNCPTCEQNFIGDKRALSCADCAYAPPKPEQHSWHVVDWMMWQFRLRMTPCPASIVRNDVN